MVLIHARQLSFTCWCVRCSYSQLCCDSHFLCVCVLTGNVYHIPVCLWLDHQHPHRAPICMVEPTQTMHVKPGKHVDSNGMCYLPYLHEWRYVGLHACRLSLSLPLSPCCLCICVHACVSLFLSVSLVFSLPHPPVFINLLFSFCICAFDPRGWWRSHDGCGKLGFQPSLTRTVKFKKFYFIISFSNSPHLYWHQSHSKLITGVVDMITLMHRLTAY